MTSKKHFLVIWPTKRKDWVSTFRQLKDDFTFTFIPATFPEEPNFANEFTCRYWSEFESAIDVLDDVQPDGIIFMSIETGLSITLNYLAHRRGIKTFILQHGIFTNYKDYRWREKLWRKETRAKSIKESQTTKGFSTFSFLKNSLKGLDRLHLLSIALYTKAQQKVGPYWAAKYLPLQLKRADEYLCYSPFNATIHRETDRISDDQIIYIGSPELIPYLKEESDLIEDDFYLHIDQALAENSFGEETVSKEKIIEFYLKLNEFCLSKNAKLYVKLHPESYQSEWLPQFDNITYLRQVENFNQVIQSAVGCFGFYSTMIIPAIYWRPTILFKIQYSGLQEAVEQIKGALILDFWNFKLDDIWLADKHLVKGAVKRQFILPEGTNQDSLKNLLNG